MELFTEQLLQISVADKERSESLCSRLADRFEDELLEYDGFPDAHLKYFLILISVEKYFEKPGIWNFILAVNNSSDALRKEQLKEITDAFVKHFKNYRDKELCFAACDFIARNIAPSEAAPLLKQLKAIEAQKDVSLRGFADEGLYIVEQEIKRANSTKTV